MQWTTGSTIAVLQCCVDHLLYTSILSTQCAYKELYDFLFRSPGNQLEWNALSGVVDSLMVHIDSSAKWAVGDLERKIELENTEAGNGKEVSAIAALTLFSWLWRWNLQVGTIERYVIHLDLICYEMKKKLVVEYRTRMCIACNVFKSTGVISTSHMVLFWLIFLVFNCACLKNLSVLKIWIISDVFKFWQTFKCCNC